MKEKFEKLGVLTYFEKNGNNDEFIVVIDNFNNDFVSLQEAIFIENKEIVNLAVINSRLKMEIR